MTQVMSCFLRLSLFPGKVKVTVEGVFLFLVESAFLFTNVFEVEESFFLFTNDLEDAEAPRRLTVLWALVLSCSFSDVYCEGAPDALLDFPVAHKDEDA